MFQDLDRTDLIKIMDFHTVKDIAYVLGMKPQEISNYYHQLIKERGPLKYCYLYQVSKNCV